ncbi:hypothetical protein JJB11_16905 [Ramlibacter ginsenosidimutans]|uniref:LapA family protein n=1 Tax=Ramlibacter ginsenosidimutans TaxID=502333 RepID=A0A934TUP5_9BURK|nr:hypothetical protein [Ramlibacter ginsenosidimutans]MBK6007781.1 hypothetical protein [Ramlibacter ginsenosidimutans]
MRTRTILLVVAILLVAGFAALNWGEVVRPTTLLFGPIAADAPLGLILLTLLALTLVLFLVSSIAMRTQSLIDYRQHHKTLEAQRELADKAEASRFVDLRQQLDTHLKEMRERDAIAASEFDKAMLQTRRELQVQMEQINRTIAARMTELENRLDGRVNRMGVPPVTPNVPPMQESVAAREAREAGVREEERIRQDSEREQREVRREERATAADKPSESGWRKWF